MAKHQPITPNQYLVQTLLARCADPNISRADFLFFGRIAMRICIAQIERTTP